MVAIPDSLIAATVANLRRQAREHAARSAECDATADRLEAAAAEGGPQAPAELTGSAAAAAAFIRAKPYRTGDEVAAAIGVEPVTFRTHIVPKLKPHGLTVRARGGGYHMPRKNVSLLSRDTIRVVARYQPREPSPIIPPPSHGPESRP